jgi:hypothetical protein
MRRVAMARSSITAAFGLPLSLMLFLLTTTAPVSEAYKVPIKFTGKIAKVTIELKEMKKTDLDDAMQARKAAALKKGLSD